MPKDPKPSRSVYELLQDIKRGEYVIPNFQRGYEWTPSMVVDLLTSIIQDYFSGLLLFWELDSGVVREEKWDPLWGAEKKDNPSSAILDGQQRLASIYYAICGPKNKFPNRNTYYMFFIDLGKCLARNYDEAISYKYSSRYLTLDEIISKKEEWIREGLVPLRLLSDRKYVDSHQFNEWLRGYAKKFLASASDANEYDSVRDRIRTIVYNILNYEFVTHVLGKDRQLPDICGIFARINQKGMRLSTFDLMNAFVYPKGIALRKLWEDLPNDRLKYVDAGMNEYLLKLMSLYKQDYCSSKYIFYLIPGQRIKKKELGEIVEIILIDDGDEFRSLWDKACEHAEKARERIMNVGKYDFGAIKYGFIPNTTIIPVLGAISLYYNDQPERTVPETEFNSIISKWYWSAVISGDYSGSSDTVMSEDYRDLKKCLHTGDTSGIRRIGKTSRDFVEQELDLKNCKKGSALYNAILCLIAANKAEDFYTTRVLDTGSYREENIDDHHIFPKGIKDLHTGLCKEFERTSDSVLNRTLLFDETNEKIRNKKPSEYLGYVLKEKLGGDGNTLRSLMSKHFISEKALDPLKQDDYDSFIEERERSIKNKLISLLET